MPLRTRKPETLALIVSLVSMLAVLTTFLADLVLAHQRDLDAGEKRLQQFSVMMAEHTARAFEAVDVLVREVSSDLSGSWPGWTGWDAARGWEYLAQRHSRAMPQLRNLAIFDQGGNLRFISTQFPPPPLNIRDRSYFEQAQAGIPSSYFGPYVDRYSGRYSYAVSHRLNDSNNVFTGLAFAAIEPGYMQDFCWSNRLSDDFDAVLTNAAGLVIASCRPADLSSQSQTIGRPASEVLRDGHGELHIPETGVVREGGLLVSVVPVPGFADLRLVAVIPKKTVLAGWRSRLFELGTLGILVTGLLFTGALLVRRQVRELSDMTEALAASRDQLEARVVEATAELAGEKEAAERANAAKSRFLAAASHDLRQPLHALSLFSTDLRRQLASGRMKDIPRLAEQIGASTGILGEMLDALLDLSRLDIDGVRTNIQSFPLASLFERLDASFRRQADDRRITLRFHPTTVHLRTDPVHLERILGNLIANALRYTPADGRVLVGVRRSGKQIRIEVRDSGVGIAREHRGAIFSEFYQVANTAREQDGGLGLGLSIVERLARALDIEVSLNSQIGEGTTFALRVPRVRWASKAPQAATPSAGRVHFIGDSEALAEVRRLVEGWHYETSGGTPDSVARLRGDTIIICDADSTPAVDRNTPLIIIGEPPAGSSSVDAHVLPLPVKPARLRALLRAAGR